jgi:hypothetical protein
MPEYLITFTAYIDARKRPENFPRVIQDKVVASFDSGPLLVDFVNKRVAVYAQNQGMGVTLDQDLIEDLSIIDTNRIWVPMHMITHFTATYKAITGEMPQVSALGLTEMPSGKEVVKH